MRDAFRKGLFRVPVVGQKLRQWYAAAERLEQLAPGHYYSPIASDHEIDQHARIESPQRRVITAQQTSLPGIDLNLPSQQQRLADIVQRMRRFQSDKPDPECLTVECSAGSPTAWMVRYPADNLYFQRFDAVILEAMIALHRPRRIVEVGSGFSTLAILDSLDHSGLMETELTVIEPDPHRLLEHLLPTDRERFELRQRVFSREDLESIDALQSNDILLVDSSHVYKIGSDVQLLFSEAIPRLSVGTVLHLHDIFFPFEYPASWLRRGHHFNEAYVLRAFLQFNDSFEILLWNDFLRHCDIFPLPDWIRGSVEELDGSIWLRRIS